MTSDADDRPQTKTDVGEEADPLDADTEKISSVRRSVAATSPPPRDAPFDPSNTTTWTGSPPPRVIDDEATVVSTPVARDPDATETIAAAVPLTPIQNAPLAPSSSLRPMLLERIEPSIGRGERLRLDAARWKVSLGRAEESDIRLYTASASREHAWIAGNEGGEWVLSPMAERSVRIDGEVVTEPIVLEVGMNILLGQDHLRCVTEGLDRSATVAATVGEGFADAEGWGSFRFGRFRVNALLGLAFGAATLIAIVSTALVLLGGG